MLGGNNGNVPQIELAESLEQSLEAQITEAVRQLRENNQFRPAFWQHTPIIDWQPQIDFGAAATAGRIEPLSEFHCEQVTDSLRRYAHNATGVRENRTVKGSRTTVRALFKGAIVDLEELIRKLNKIADSQWNAPELTHEAARNMHIELGKFDLRAAIDTYIRAATDPFNVAEGSTNETGHLTWLLDALKGACSSTGTAGSPPRNWPLAQLLKELGETFEVAGGIMAAKFDSEKGQMSEGPFIRFAAAILEAGPERAPTRQAISRATDDIIKSKANFPGDHCDGPLTGHSVKYHTCRGKFCSCKSVNWRREMRREIAKDNNVTESY
jgi:hypothetical protein